tara:strand:- start:830 stop:2329 length:1500 start_codon:yes stop_codon:yes gene_type:complete
MLDIISAKDSIRLDQETINNKISTKKQLIQCAGRAIAFHLIDNIHNPFNKTFICIAGNGDNGMDAITCHKILRKNSVNSSLFVIEKSKVKASYLDKEVYFSKIKDVDFSSYDIIVDGIFGTGLNRQVEGDFADVINKISKCKNVVSIDIPSGIFSDTGTTSGPSVNAFSTITFSRPKICHFIGEGYKKRGELFIYQIGHQEDLINSNIKLILDEDISNKIKPNPKDNDKYMNGKILTLTGSAKYSGASILSGKAALKSGAGIIKQIFPSSLGNYFSNFIEAVDCSIDDKNLGFLTNSSFDYISNEFHWPDCFLIGPGVSIDEKSLSLIKNILLNYKGKCVVDATALNSINYKKDKFRNIPESSILTPHYNEFAKMIDISVEVLKYDIIKHIKEVCKFLENRILVLKGPNTIIADGQNNFYVIDKGTYNLGTAGTGDILSGIISSYVASGYTLIDSAIIGASIHSHISSILMNENIESILAGEMLPYINKSQNYFMNYRD